MDVESASATLVLIAVASIIAYVSAAEVALASTSRSRIRRLLDEGIEQARILDALLDDPARFLSTLLLVKSVSYVASGATLLYLSIQRSWSPMELLLNLGLAWFGLVLVQIGMRAVALRQPERTALRLGPSVRILSNLFLPFSFVLRWFGARIRGQRQELPAENIFLSEDGLRFLINVGEGEGVIEEEEKQMIASIFELGETAVREIMVPRLDIIAINADDDLNDALDVIIENGHSRIPIYDENIDHIVGLLYAKDLLRCFRDKRTPGSVRSILRKPYFVPQSKKLDELFHDMQVRRIHIAIVVDEYGGTAGVVTIEDLLEEIVGEIQDEYDTEEPHVQQLGPHAYLFNARIDLDEVSDRIGVDLSERHENIDTLGGFIYSELGRVPEQGATVEYQNYRFTVLSIDSRRIEQVRVEGSRPQQRTPEEALGATGEPSPGAVDSTAQSGEHRDGRFFGFTT